MSKRKFYYILILLFIVSATSRIDSVKAHPPSGIVLFYNSNTNKLNATISHSVSNPSNHFVLSVVIEVNGTTTVSETYTSQPSSILFTYQYNVTANNGARIQASATCNQGGTVTECIVVGGGTCGSSNGSGIPGYSGLLLILGISIIALLFIVRRNRSKGQLSEV
ncbi:MAG: hypothetical protein KGD58_02505 [Candidatus Lokiarchaeota archaeon]|nr:hypothetical protein [Candidatus Lokiarchaeota archaeon]